ncbi:DEAD/DEAH box helicase [Paenibacillus agaridevorans]|uniref:DEAD/DEAH box helicase n=1 Tax=Paenibacillus agaridevorans TaxID=171404 RepID=UPI001BE3F760|nr:DEAD/DEAH box helicase [Paenibacillus agaridevorans]
MRTSLNFRSLTVDGKWSMEEGNPALLLGAVERKDLTEGRLRSLLFAWHKASWYGADVEEERIGGQSLLKLSPLAAVDYLSQPRHVRLLDVKWSDRLSVLIRIAGMIRTMLLRGWYMPDWQHWSEERRSWRADLPEDAAEFANDWEQALRDAAEHGDARAEAWLGAAIEELLVSDNDAAAAWAEIGNKMGEGVLRQKGSDEDEWLIAIGFRRDMLPFRVALQLLEPGEGLGWRLRPALQDQSGGEWRTIAKNPAGDWQAERKDEAGPEYGDYDANGVVDLDAGNGLPADWQEPLVGKMNKEESKWAQVLPHLAEAGESEDEAGDRTIKDSASLRWSLTEQEAWSFLEHDSLRLLEAGTPVLLPAWWEAVRSRKLRVRAKLKSSVGSAAQPMFGLDQIVQFDWKLALGNIDLSEAEFMQMAEENRRLVQVGDQWVHLDPQDVAEIRAWMKRVGKRKGLSFRDVLEMHLRGGSEMELDSESEDGLRAEVELNEHLGAWLAQLQQVSRIPEAELPSSFLGELRPYQLQGVSWLLFLRQFGLGGVLADDMGLGKTIQFIAYLCCVQASGDPAAGASLLVCPTSVIGNWEKELRRFAPSLRVHIHYGGKRLKGEELKELAGEYDLVITSYSLAQLDEEDIGAVEWNALCLDEAQNIKNVYTKQSSAIRSFGARHRIALTGTPMENRLTELWSIYDFINPGYLGSMADFRRVVVAPIERTRDETMIQGLQRWVRPFMLRRVKKDPAIQLSLPDKIESKSFMTLTAEQGTLYENIVSELMEKLDTLDAMQRRGLILATLTKLKQLCDHPALLLHETETEKWDAERSGKMARLLEMCEEIAAEGERCLIFTQFVEMGARIKETLEASLGIKVPYLHGGVPKAKRDEMITAFQEDEKGGAFVLSLKAGGTGLNLTAANHVFHFDRWWNPAVENQATDRAFRIGQTRQVQVHKFITLGTLEEKIDEMIESKQSLNDQVVGVSEQWITEMSTDELKDLFALRDDWLKG